MKAEEISLKILKDLEHGWNYASGAEFSRTFAERSEFVDIRGVLHQNVSPQYVGEAHQGLFMSIYKDSKITYELIQAFDIDMNTILLNGRTTLEVPSGPFSGTNNSIITAVLTNHEGNWKIRAFQNTLTIRH